MEDSCCCCGGCCSASPSPWSEGGRIDREDMVIFSVYAELGWLDWKFVTHEWERESTEYRSC